MKSRFFLIVILTINNALYGAIFAPNAINAALDKESYIRKGFEDLFGLKKKSVNMNTVSVTDFYPKVSMGENENLKMVTKAMESLRGVYPGQFSNQKYPGISLMQSTYGIIGYVGIPVVNSKIESNESNQQVAVIWIAANPGVGSKFYLLGADGSGQYIGYGMTDDLTKPVDFSLLTHHVSLDCSSVAVLFDYTKNVIGKENPPAVNITLAQGVQPATSQVIPADYSNFVSSAEKANLYSVDKAMRSLIRIYPGKFSNEKYPGIGLSQSAYGIIGIAGVPVVNSGIETVPWKPQLAIILIGVNPGAGSKFYLLGSDAAGNFIGYGATNDLKNPVDFSLLTHRVKIDCSSVAQLFDYTKNVIGKENPPAVTITLVQPLATQTIPADYSPYTPEPERAKLTAIDTTMKNLRKFYPGQFSDKKYPGISLMESAAGLIGYVGIPVGNSKIETIPWEAQVAIIWIAKESESKYYLLGSDEAGNVIGYAVTNDLTKPVSFSLLRHRVNLDCSSVIPLFDSKKNVLAQTNPTVPTITVMKSGDSISTSSALESTDVAMKTLCKNIYPGLFVDAKYPNIELRQSIYGIIGCVNVPVSGLPKVDEKDISFIKIAVNPSKNPHFYIVAYDSTEYPLGYSSSDDLSKPVTLHLKTQDISVDCSSVISLFDSTKNVLAKTNPKVPAITVMQSGDSVSMPTPNTQASNTPVPDKAVTDTQASNTPAPDKAVPDTQASSTPVPDKVVPDIQAPNTPVTDKAANKSKEFTPEQTAIFTKIIQAVELLSKYVYPGKFTNEKYPHVDFWQSVYGIIGCVMFNVEGVSDKVNGVVKLLKVIVNPGQGQKFYIVGYDTKNNPTAYASTDNLSKVSLNMPGSKINVDLSSIAPLFDMTAKVINKKNPSQVKLTVLE